MKKRTEAFLLLLHDTFKVIFVWKTQTKFEEISDFVE